MTHQHQGDADLARRMEGIRLAQEAAERARQLADAERARREAAQQGGAR